MQIRANDYQANEILKFIRESTNLSQAEFAKLIDKSKDWQQSNELGRSKYFFKDLLELCNKNNIDILFVERNGKKNRK